MSYGIWMSAGYCMESKQISRIDIRVAPKSSQSKIVIEESARIKVFVNSPPADGKANAECIRLMARALDISKSRIEIEKGASARTKRIAITGLTTDEILKRLTHHVESSR
ncbi:MAG: DUF167 domain-containing protein [Spirochaetes bacterium]|nr:MAG: DUF167 domain-containing protein [Spirochaetota bacterium]